jgi:type IV secretion system protein VirD4
MMYGRVRGTLAQPRTGWKKHLVNPHLLERTTGPGCRDMFDPNELNPVDDNHARLLRRGTAGENVYLPDFAESMAHFDEAVRILRASSRRPRL